MCLFIFSSLARPWPVHLSSGLIRQTLTRNVMSVITSYTRDFYDIASLCNSERRPKDGPRFAFATKEMTDGNLFVHILDSCGTVTIVLTSGYLRICRRLIGRGLR